MKSNEVYMYVELPLVYVLSVVLDGWFLQGFSLKVIWLTLIFYSVRRGILIHVLSVSMFFLSIFLEETAFMVNVNLLESSVLVGVTTVTALINTFRMHKMRYLMRDLNEKDREISELKDRITYMKSIIEDLRDRIFYEGEGISSLFMKLKDVRMDNSRIFYGDFVKIVSDFFSIPGMSVYRYRHGFYRLLASTKPSIFGFTFREGVSVVVDEAVKKGSARITDLFDRELSNVEPWMAVSIGKEPKGMLIVDEIDPAKLNKPYEKYLSALCSWLDAMMGRVEEFEILKGNRLPDRTYPPDMYEEIREELEDMEKSGLPFSEVCICSDKIDEILRFLREDDISTRFKRNDYECLRILLPMCDDHGKKRFLERLRRSLGEDPKICDVD